MRAIAKVEAIRRRNGASDWLVFRDLGEDGRFVERFIIRSWAEYVRLRTRMTMADREKQDRRRAAAASGRAGARFAPDRNVGHGAAGATGERAERSGAAVQSRSSPRCTRSTRSS